MVDAKQKSKRLPAQGRPSAGGMKLATRFALTMTLALLPVVLVAGFVLYQRTAELAQQVQDKAFVEAAAIQGPRLELVHDSYRRERMGLPPQEDSVVVAPKAGSARGRGRWSPDPVASNRTNRCWSTSGATRRASPCCRRSPCPRN